MTTVDIESAANDDNIAAPDMPIKTILRNYVVPAFYLDVGDVRWRRVSATLTLAVGTKQYDLPDDFFKMIELFMPPIGAQNLSPQNDRVKYIGEDPSAVAVADFNSTNGKPGGWYISHRSAGETLRAISFDTPPDAAYVAYYTYLSGTPFTDLITSVDMDKYIPPMLQPALICGLRAEILMRRYGQGDSRYMAEKGRYNEWVARMTESTDLARRNFKKFVS